MQPASSGGAERVYLLFVLDDQSRYLAGDTVAGEPSSEMAVATFKAAIARHGNCEAVYTDRGGAFLAWRDRSVFARQAILRLPGARPGP